MAPIVAAMSSGARPSAAGSRRWAPPRCASSAGGSLVRHPWRITPALTLPAIVGRRRPARLLVLGDPGDGVSSSDFVATMMAAAVFFGPERWRWPGRCSPFERVNRFRTVVAGDSRETAFNNLALAPLGWLMALVYAIQWWATLLFALPLYTTRMASQRFVEMRDMFTQTIGALGGGGRQARSVHGAAQPAGQGDRGRHRAGHAGQRRGARGAGVGRPAP